MVDSNEVIHGMRHLAEVLDAEPAPGIAEWNRIIALDVWERDWKAAAEKRREKRGLS